MTTFSTTFAVLALIAAPVGAFSASTATSSSRQIEPGAGTWHTWVLASGRELRPPTPPDQAATQTELAQLHTLESERNTRGLDLVSYWDAGAPAYRWNENAIRRLESIGRPEVVCGLWLVAGSSSAPGRLPIGPTKEGRGSSAY